MKQINTDEGMQVEVESNKVLNLADYRKEKEIKNFEKNLAIISLIDLIDQSKTLIGELNDNKLNITLAQKSDLVLKELSTRLNCSMSLSESIDQMRRSIDEKVSTLEF